MRTKEIQPSNLLHKLSPTALGWVVFAILLGSSSAVLGLLYVQASARVEESIHDQLRNLSRLAARQIDVAQHESLTSREQMRAASYQAALAPLVEFHLLLPDIVYLYTVRDAIEDEHQYLVLDTINDPRIAAIAEQSERPVRLSPLMESHDETVENAAFDITMASGETYIFPEPRADFYGRYLGARSPLIDQNGRYVGYVAIDYNLKSFDARMDQMRFSGLLALALTTLMSLLLARLAYSMRLQSMRQLAKIKAAESVLWEQKDRAENLSKAKSELLAIAAHDLKNPLNAVTGLTEILIAQRKSLPPERQDEQEMEILETVRDGASHMAKLVHQILANEGLEAHGLTFDPTPFDMAPLVQKVVEFNAQRAENKGITITTEIVRGMRCQVDPTRIQEAFDNLVSNAVKYTPMAEEKEIHVRLEHLGRHARFSVTDQGPGLSAADQAKLFGKFQRLSSVPTDGESSTGLGLSIVKTIAEMHDGRVGCESQLGAGCCFWIELPLLNG
ncbi:sensor histidine kinase [Synoicihabitans lomoniglobus]|uniref:histidine kinase n=1 Tax=Synoicihabitans lomoniglobus TaxID=2909285 RepID=A0AAF0A001_9BACT|nr:HAMP domain-containing histidine kinase [Opitutaceae bacterium LMO-M01]WED64663.1 ATP-binding protein [Opitutaceae bacterium LMO-M01]